MTTQQKKKILIQGVSVGPEESAKSILKNADVIYIYIYIYMHIYTCIYIYIHIYLFLFFLDVGQPIRAFKRLQQTTPAGDSHV